MATKKKSKYDLIAGFDGGGSHTSAALSDLDLNIIAKAGSGPTNIYTVDPKLVAFRLRTIIDKLLEHTKIKKNKILFVLGLAGISRPEDKRKMTAILNKLNIKKNCLITNDAEIALLTGTSGERRGLLVLSGTGSIIYGVSGHKTKRGGGWGANLRDEGSAYWIALQTLKYVSRADDKLLPKTVLSKRVLKFLSLSKPMDLLPYLDKIKYSRSDIAALAPVVFKCADKDHDYFAKKIIRKASEELVRLAIIVAKDLYKHNEEFPVILSGGVFAHEKRFQNLFIKSFKKTFPKAIYKVNDSRSVMGALMLGKQYIDN